MRSTHEPTVPVGADARRAVTVSLSTQLVAKVLHLGLNVVSSLAVIRYLAPGVYGDYVLIVTMVTIFGMICEFGLEKVAVRDIAGEPLIEGSVVGTVLILRLSLALISLAGIQLVLLALDRSTEVRTAAAIASLLLVVNAALAVTISFHVRVRQQLEAGALLLGEAVETALIVALVITGATLSQLLLAPVVGAVVTVGIAVLIARRRFHVRPSVSRARIRPILGDAAPVALASIIGILILRMDSLVLAAFRTPRDVGVYGAAMQLLEYVLVGAVTLTTVLLSLVSESFAHDRDRFFGLVQQGTVGILVAAIPVVVVIIAMAPLIVDTAYDAEYAAAVTPMRILAATLLLFLLSAWNALVLLAAHHQRTTVVYNAWALVFGFGVQLVAVSAYGVPGAAWATTITAAATCGASAVVLRRRVGVRLSLADPARIGVGAGAMATVYVVAQAGGVPVLAATPLALLAYAGVIHLLGVVRLPDLRSKLASLGPASDTTHPEAR